MLKYESMCNLPHIISGGQYHHFILLFLRVLDMICNMKKYLEYKEEMRTLYKSIEKVYCPILESDISFNSNGFHHLQYKPDGTARDTKEARYKMKLLPLAIPVIKNAVGIADKRNVKVRIGRGKRSKLKNAIAYALVAVVGAKNPVAIRVIIVKAGNGKPYFYSIMKDNKKRKHG